MARFDRKEWHYQTEIHTPGTSMGMYAQVMFVLGLEKDLLLLAKDDVLGRKLQDIGLKTGHRVPKK